MMERGAFLTQQFVNKQKERILARINKYTSRKRIKNELTAGDVSLYTIYKQIEVLPQLKKTLLKIEKGEYGKCEKCGEIIEEKRLRAVPAAACCQTCM
jgi:RNA polymerase-binding transcription factor DksA